MKKRKPKWKRQSLRTEKELGTKHSHTKDKEFDLMAGKKVFVAHRDFPEFCNKCFKDIVKDQSYIIHNKQLTHFKCSQQ